MRYRSWLPLAPLLLLAAGLAAACFGSSGGAPDPSGIVTATPPDPLPEALIVGETLPPAEGTVYIVQAGDTLSFIAAQFATTIDAIVEANGIVDPRRLFVGQQLVIPGITDGSDVLGATVEPSATAPAPPTPRPTPSGSDCTYSVRSGDFAAAIAPRFGISVEELAVLNSTTVDDLRTLAIGDLLIVPCLTPTATPQPPAATPAAPPPTGAGDCTYTVQSGDIAVAIAAQFDISVEELAALNGTTVDDLRTLNIDDVLIVPCS